ncbi:hypothetical protein MMC25_006754 [Agyrium rufum]|nr:hypothetical protein [Agyrium rufum]
MEEGQPPPLYRYPGHSTDSIEIPGTPPTACNTDSILEAESSYVDSPQDDWMQDSASITSSILDYEFENGRRYHAYKAGHYPLPNDESELDRLDLQHHVITLLLNGELHLAPLTNPKKMLDIGCGTGLWAIEIADRFPNAVVIGTDLSPVQPNWVPGNVRFEIDDMESEWLYKDNSFDYIHSRYMIGAISDWQMLIRRAYKHCKPGGYFEIQELDPRLDSDDGSHRQSPIHVWCTDLLRSSSKEAGKPVPTYDQYKGWFEEAGFVDVRVTYFKIPTNSWPKKKELKEVGKYQLINYTEGYEAICIGLFTRVLHWQPAEVQVLLAKLRVELKDRNIHTYQVFTCIHGRKPLAHELQARRMEMPPPPPPYQRTADDKLPGIEISSPSANVRADGHFTPTL